MHQRLDALSQRLVGQGDDAGRRMTLGDFASEVRSGEHPGRDARQYLGHHLGHPQVRPHLDSLGQADDGLQRPATSAQPVSTSRKPCEGTAMNTMPRALECLVQRRGHRQPVGQRDAGQIAPVLARSARMEAASSSDRAHRVAGCVARRSWPPRSPRTRPRSLPPARVMPQETTAGPPPLLPDPYTVGVSRVVVPAAWDATLDADVRLGPEVVLDPREGVSSGEAAVGHGAERPRAGAAGAGMATHVVRPAHRFPVAVVCDDEVVAAWAEEQAPASCGRRVTASTAPSRPASIASAQAGARWVTVAHGDLPRAKGLGTLPPFDGVTLVPDRRDDGTNVLRLPAAADFRFA